MINKSVFGGGTQSRTGDRGFADLGLNHLAMPPLTGVYFRHISTEIQ